MGAGDVRVSERNGRSVGEAEHRPVAGDGLLRLSGTEVLGITVANGR